MAFYILSERASNHHVAWGTSYELENVVADCFDGEILAPPGLSVHPKLDMALGKVIGNRYRRLKDFRFADESVVLW